MVQVARGARFQPNGLPKAAGGTIPAHLAMGDVGKVVWRGITRTGKVAVHLDPHGLALQILGDRDLEWQPAIVTATNFAPRHANHGEIGHRAETQERNALCWNGDVSAVSGMTVGQSQVGKGGLPGLRHLNLARQSIDVMNEIPTTIQGKDRTARNCSHHGVLR